MSPPLWRRNRRVAVAAVNGPRSTVVSGPAEAVDRITRTLAARGANVTPLAVSHAFHSPLMAPAQAAFRDIAGAVTPREAKIPLVSTLHGGVVVGTDMDADYWAAQLTSTVRFADAIATATTQAAPTHLVELGPRPTLVALARRCGIATQIRTLSPCRGPDDDGAGFARVAAQLYADGVTIRFDNLYRDESRTLKRLPPYAFGDGTRFWREPDTAPVPSVRDRPVGATRCRRGSRPHPNPTPPPAATPSPRPFVSSLPISAATPPMNPPRRPARRGPRLRLAAAATPHRPAAHRISAAGRRTHRRTATRHHQSR